MSKKMLWSRFAFWSLFFLVVQQLIVASSTFWITYLSQSVVTGQHIIFYLSLLVASLFIVYIPGIVSTYTLEKAKSQALYRYTEAFSEAHQCIPTHLNEKEFQQDKEPWLTSENSKTIEEVYYVVYDAASTGLNTVLNIAALCIAIDSRMLIGYLISFLLLPLVSNRFKNQLEETAITLQDDRKNMSQTLLSGWDNILIGNRYNFAIWWKQFKKRWESYNNSSAYAALITSLASTVAMICSLIPVAATFIWLFINTSDTLKLAALIATLPRQIQIIQHFQILTSYTMHWQGTFARLKELMSSLLLTKNDKSNFIKRVKQDQVGYVVNGSSVQFSSFEKLLQAINNLKYGRITIHGKNGTGKTTLTNLLKEELKDNAYYLPTNSRLFFDTTLEASHSTGQRVKACLQELAQKYFQGESHSTIPVLILDEWDANLDFKNVESISTILDDFATRCVVVEISHRRYGEHHVLSGGGLLEVKAEFENKVQILSE
jgi:ABC-type multidrug transport system fused ATPase/permease subunit